MEPQRRASFYQALDLYNRGEYLDCQESLEQVHAGADASDQPLVRAVLMLACAMHLHFRRGGGRGTLNLVRQSLVTMEPFRPRHLGVEVGELYEALEAYLEELKDRRKAGAIFFDRWLVPRVRYRREPE